MANVSHDMYLHPFLMVHQKVSHSWLASVSGNATKKRERENSNQWRCPNSPIPLLFFFCQCNLHQCKNSITEWRTRPYIFSFYQPEINNIQILKATYFQICKCSKFHVVLTSISCALSLSIAAHSALLNGVVTELQWYSTQLCGVLVHN